MHACKRKKRNMLGERQEGAKRKGNGNGKKLVEEGEGNTIVYCMYIYRYVEEYERRKRLG